jgi:hypothetical protein
MWRLKDVNVRFAIDQTLSTFAIGHKIKIGYLLTFKMLRHDVHNVTMRWS